MPSPTPAAMPQRDVRAAALLEQGRRQKAELDRMVKPSFAHSASISSTSTTSRAGRMHPKDASAKLLDADIDFARRNLRNTWLNLLFTCTFTREAQAVDGYIWNDTSYTLISAYRTYISAAQKAVDPASAPAAAQAPGRRGKSAQDASRVKAEYRKFLVDEELFWHELVGRLVRLFSLDEARANLEALGIDADNDADSSLASSLPSDSFTSRANRHDNEPDESLSQAALLPAKRTHLVTLLHKFLIFCGDLARYREMSSHDPPADAASAPSKRPKPTPKYDFSRASAFYEQARLILPDQGNPANQLAVVSTYKGDTFASLYYYYRALCVKTPFAKAKINLEKLLAKPTAAWLDEASRSTHASAYTWDAAKDAELRDPQLVARLAADVELAERTTEAWLKQVVVLHGLFYRRSHLDHIMYLSRCVLATFSTLVRARALRADQIVQFLVTALCASWTTRLWRSAPSSVSRDAPRPSSEGSEDPHRPRAIRSERSSRKRAPSPETGRCVEFQVTAHVLGVFRELCAVDTTETRKALEASKAAAAALGDDGAEASPIRNLTAVVRRTLPAMRIVTKWTKTHLEYMQRIEKRAREAVQQFGDADQEVVRSGMEVRPDSEQPNAHHTAYVDTLEAMDRCWSQYVDMINSLRYAFPFDALPNIGKVGAVGAAALCLEEDSDMRGFAPTRKATQSTIPGGTTISVGMGEACANMEAVRPSQVHPNEEQLMRIADLMIDAKVIAESDASPIHFDDTNNVFEYRRRAEVKPAATSAPNGATRTEAEENGSSASVDDPVEAAMRAAVGRPETDVESMEQSLRSVDLEGERSQAEQLLVPSQVRSKAAQNRDELARQLFAAYPLASSSTGAAGPGVNTAPLSSIWAPSASEMNAGATNLPPHLASYGGRNDLYQRPMQAAYPTPSWSNHSYPQHAGSMAGGFGNTTPDPFNPHAYGAAPGMHAHHGQMHYQGGAPYAPSMMDASQPRMTPMPGDVHGTRRSQDAYYPGATGAGAPQHPPRFG
ncbi:uncharacterized protein PAN0_059d6511 [Moesziomyces antarcticus]|uniref:Uncharacterized protein n=2 Tax=Pseudozyma antarctica TaxID=84753 RepID=A0A081CNM4_PSEA2|nr:uncharacterized protein PAN0_059d6511 [Moesziomyces antarcticus]GAK68270.1 conserved hypothetical protein [Moesziomyces antarcticus]SPO47266.1 uncharacterized protein PSANT_04954 [Moesziomyces antarcticus]